MGNVVRLGQGRASVSLGSCMGKLQVMFWALFLAASVMALCSLWRLSWGALAVLHRVLGGICCQFTGAWHILPGPLGCVSGPAEGRARQALLLPRG